MESNTLPTAESYFNEYALLLGFHNWEEMMFRLQFEPDLLNKHIKIASKEYAILFAKHIRKEMIEAIKEKVEVVFDKDGDYIGIDGDSIENAYSEYRIV